VPPFLIERGLFYGRYIMNRLITFEEIMRMKSQKKPNHASKRTPKKPVVKKPAKVVNRKAKPCTTHPWVASQRYILGYYRSKALATAAVKRAMKADVWSAREGGHVSKINTLFSPNVEVKMVEVK
jgi:hypothetical protein